MKTLTTAATIAAVLITAGAAMATPVVPRANGGAPPPSANRGTHGNEQNLQTARRDILRSIDSLSRDANDYGGHRESAMDDLGVARQFLEQAIQYRNSHGSGNRGGVPSAGYPHRNPGAGGTPIPIDNPGSYGTPIPIDNRGTYGTPIPIDNRNGSGDTDDQNGQGNRPRGQYTSNHDLTSVRQDVQSAIDALNRDGFEYGGFKERAVDKLQAAETQIDDALQFVHRPGVRNGGSGQRVSNANLRFVDEHVRTAIGRLEDDRNDYGGHRAAAISDLQQARIYLGDALSFDNSHGHNGQPVSPNTVVPSTVSTGVLNTDAIIPSTGGLSGGTVGPNGQVTNDGILADARKNLESAIDALRNDANDYGGFREKAVGSLEAARQQLLLAEQFRR